MTNLENELSTQLEKKLSKVTTDKRRLYALYSEPAHTPVHRARTVRVAAIALAAALLLCGTTAYAMTSPRVMSAIRAIIERETTDLDLTDEKKDDLTELYEYWHVDSQEVPRRLGEMNVNSYGETVGDMHTSDLFGVASHNGSGHGYVYRYDYGIVYPYMLTDAERSAIEQNGDDLRLRPTDTKTGSKRGWVYVFDFDGMEILGKYCNYLGFVTNEELETDYYKERFTQGECIEPYDEFVKDRIAYKKEHGEAPKIEKVYVSYGADMPTEGFDHEIKIPLNEWFEGKWNEDDGPAPCEHFVPPLSDNATVSCDDPSVFEFTEFDFHEYGSIHPKPYLCGVFHKTGSTYFTVKDGDNEYRFRVSCQVGCNVYDCTWDWLNADEYK